MRKINHIVIHCTATGLNTKIENIQRYWREQLGWKNPGYHYVVNKFGAIIQLAGEESVTNGVAGYNQNSVHISYIGGIDEKGNPKDTRTDAQKKAIRAKVADLKRRYPQARVLGHRDFPGVKKACPSFDVATEL